MSDDESRAFQNGYGGGPRDYSLNSPAQVAAYERGVAQRRGQNAGGVAPIMAGAGSPVLGLFVLIFALLSVVYVAVPALVASIPVLIFARASRGREKPKGRYWKAYWARYWKAYWAAFWGLTAYEAVEAVLLGIKGASKNEIPRLLFYTPLKDIPSTAILWLLTWQIVGPLAFAAVLRWRMHDSFSGARGFRKAYVASLSAVALTVAVAVGIGRSATSGEVAIAPAVTAPVQRARSETPRDPPAHGTATPPKAHN
jgi:hypothetical protein